MKHSPTNHVVLSAVGQNLLRILIASHFLAGAIGLIPGTDLTPLTDTLLPLSLSGPFANATVFTLAYLVMIGVWLRGAALLLGILTFWSSYMQMVALGVEHELGQFWRDLAMIAALMLTYAVPEPRSHRKRAISRRKVVPRRVVTVSPRTKRPDGATGPARPTANLLSPDFSRKDPAWDKIGPQELDGVFRHEPPKARSA